MIFHPCIRYFLTRVNKCLFHGFTKFEVYNMSEPESEAEEALSDGGTSGESFDTSDSDENRNGLSMMEVNRSKRVQTAGDENADGWLCRRKKMKGSSPALKTPGQCRGHFPHSPLVSLVSSKQTSFFNPPRLQPFPSSQNEGTSLLAPSVSESQSQQSSENCSASCFPQFNPEGISPGVLERVSSPYSASLHDATRHFPSAAETVTSHDENEKLEASGVSQTKSLPAKMKRKSDCYPGSVGEYSSQYEFCFSEKQNASDESIRDTENILPWFRGETEESTLPENTGIAGRQHQEVVTFPDSLQTPEFQQDIVIGMDVDERTLLEFPEREVLKSKSVDGSSESPRPDCQVQITKEKSSLELDTYQNSPRSGSDEEKIYNINESGETEESTLPENTGIAGRQHQEVVTFPDSLQTPEFQQDIVIGMDVDERTLLEFPEREVLKSKSVDGSSESPRPDCQVQITKEKSSLELDTYQNSPRSGSDEEKIYNINESGDSSQDSAMSGSWHRKKENKSSLEANTYHCNSSSDSARSGSWQRKKENKSSLEANT